MGRTVVARALESAAVVLLLVLAPARAVAEPPAQVAVSPSRFELDLSSGSRTESLTLFNFGPEAVDIATSVVNWDLDEKNEVRILPPHEQSLDQWLVVNPLRFSVAAGRSQTVRFSVRPRVRPEPGEHRAMIYLDQVLTEAPSKAVRVRFRLGVAIYAQTGEPQRAARLNVAQVVAGSEPLRATLDVSSFGTSHARLNGQYAIWPAESYPGAEHTTAVADLERNAALPSGVLHAGPLPAGPVLPSTRRELLLQTAARLPPGSYVLDLNGELPGETVDVGIPFTVTQPLQVAGARD